MIEIASRVIIVADHTKFGRGAMIPVGRWRTPIRLSPTANSTPNTWSCCAAKASKCCWRSGSGRWVRLRCPDSGWFALASCRISLSMRCLFVPPLPSPLAVDWCVSGLLCGGHRENSHNK